jgi:hypothetical protein
MSVVTPSPGTEENEGRKIRWDVNLQKTTQFIYLIFQIKKKQHLWTYSLELELLPSKKEMLDKLLLRLGR